MATNYHEITPGQWVQVSSGPCLVEVQNHISGRLHVGANQPPEATKAWHKISKGNHFSCDAEQNVWVFNNESRTLKLVVTES